MKDQITLHAAPNVSMRVLLGNSVFEDAAVTLNGGRLFIEFKAPDLDEIMVDLRPFTKEPS
jgi:hypothetical protein